MTHVVVIGRADTTFSAQCDLCGTTFAGRLDEDLDEGVFLCREGHSVHIVRAHDPPQEHAAAASAA